MLSIICELFVVLEIAALIVFIIDKKENGSLSKIGHCNMLLFQLFGFRVMKTIDGKTNELLALHIIWLILPFTGWLGGYIKIEMPQILLYKKVRSN